MEKQLYMVEFEDKSDMKLESKADIEAGYKSVEYGGSCKYSYTPNVVLKRQSADILQGWTGGSCGRLSERFLQKQ